MIYRELKVYETPLGLKKTTSAKLCERVIYGHVIFKIDLIPSIFEYMAILTGTAELEINYSKIRDSIVTALSGDCSDEQYIAALTHIYECSPFFETYINYHYIMCRNGIDIKDLILPLVNCIVQAGRNVIQAARGTLIAEDSGYMYLLDANRNALHNHKYVAIG